MSPVRCIELPVAAPVRVLATGAFLKNTACYVVKHRAWLSQVHGDLGTPEARVALERSVRALVDVAGGAPEVVAHDLHPDFFSTTLAQCLAHEFNVPSMAVQHHHAHIAVVQAEQGWVHEPVIGLALDGAGLGCDGHSWGGEVLRVAAGRFQRLDHLPWLRLPGGDAAAREPWRVAAGVLHALGRAGELEARFCPHAPLASVRGVLRMLERNALCSLSSGGGRWFDAAAAILGIWQGEQSEAQAAVALEQAADRWWARHPDAGAVGPDSTLPQSPGIDLMALMDALCVETDRDRGAARFHEALSIWLVEQVRAASPSGPDRIALGGGCFLNVRLRERVTQGLIKLGHDVYRPMRVSVGDAGIALGQAWAASWSMASHRSMRSDAQSRLEMEI